MWDINITRNGVGPLGVAELSFQIFCKLCYHKIKNVLKKKSKQNKKQFQWFYKH